MAYSARPPTDLRLLQCMSRTEVMIEEPDLICFGFIHS